jgi:hypothetical protein
MKVSSHSKLQVSENSLTASSLPFPQKQAWNNSPKKAKQPLSGLLKEHQNPAIISPGCCSPAVK